MTQVQNGTSSESTTSKDFNIPEMLLNVLFLLFLNLFNSFAFTETQENFVTPLLEETVVESPAFVTFKQFHQAVNASLPYLAEPLSKKKRAKLFAKNVLAYPDFMNYAVTVGNITSTDELAMYLAQVLYQSNGFKHNCDPACKDPSSPNCAGLKLNTTVYTSPVNYYGRGYLWIQGQSAYTDCNRELFGEDSTLILYPDAIRASETINWATSAWYWKRFVHPIMTTFGSTIKILRPSQCNGSAVTPTTEATNSWNIYAAILKIFSPTTGPSTQFC